MKKLIHPTWFLKANVYCNGIFIKQVSSTKSILSVDIWSGTHPFFIKKKTKYLKNQTDRFLKKYKI
uniref:Large ribosomal subunit protein bL31c n=1 Tax=Pteridomonas sp. YPF1301 TaxID=2766739 RepID=A0A7G1MRU0_9STRA|nr:ribosomal protein L31 [Pteridomonas sp. YPF1301]